MDDEIAQHEDLTQELLITQEEPDVVRTGTIWSAMAHIITGVIGAGVLSLAWSVAQLGLVAGPVMIIVFAGITWFATNLIIDCYRAPNVEHGPMRNRSYTEAVGYFLGSRSLLASKIVMSIAQIGTGVTYTITAAMSARVVWESFCSLWSGHKAASSSGDRCYMLMFGGLQVLVSLVPDFRRLKWLSDVSAIMSITYSIIGLVLGLTKVIENGAINGTIGGMHTSSTISKILSIFQALGDIAFAFPFSVIVLEIQDTLRSPPSQNTTMKKGTKYAMIVTTFFYLCCGFFGYAAFGNATPGNLLTGFDKPIWLIDIANLCIIIHLVGGYQIFSQPMFTFFEKELIDQFSNNIHINRARTFNIYGYSFNLLRFFVRTFYVFVTTGVAILIPFFNQVIGVLGGIIFWFMVIYFPVQMHIQQNNIQRLSSQWFALHVFNGVCLCFCLLAVVGSVYGIILAFF